MNESINNLNNQLLSQWFIHSFSTHMLQVDLLLNQGKMIFFKLFLHILCSVYAILYVYTPHTLAFSIYPLLSCSFSPATPGPEVEDARRIAEKGKPILGKHSRLEVIIEESMAFKVYIYACIH